MDSTTASDPQPQQQQPQPQQQQPQQQQSHQHQQPQQQQQQQQPQHHHHQQQHLSKPQPQPRPQQQQPHQHQPQQQHQQHPQHAHQGQPQATQAAYPPQPAPIPQYTNYPYPPRFSAYGPPQYGPPHYISYQGPPPPWVPQAPTNYQSVQTQQFAPNMVNSQPQPNVPHNRPSTQNIITPAYNIDRPHNQQGLQQVNAMSTPMMSKPLISRPKVKAILKTPEGQILPLGENPSTTTTTTPSTKTTPTPSNTTTNAEFVHTLLQKVSEVAEDKPAESSNSVKQKTDGTIEDGQETDALKKTFRSILNKLTPNNFDNLAESVTKLHIDTESKLGDVIDIVFAKALAEPSYCALHVQICSHLKKTTAEGTNFGNTLMKRCQNQFQTDAYCSLNLDESKKKIEEEQDPVAKKRLEKELYENLNRCRMRGLSLIKFIGELYKVELLGDALTLDCIRRLLSDNQSEEALECLCDLLVTIGEKLDASTNQKATANVEKERNKTKSASKPNAHQTGQKQSMASVLAGTPQQQKADNPPLDHVFEQLHKIRKNNDIPLSERIRIKLLDTCDLREKDKWQSKRTEDNNPKKIQEIEEPHEEKLELEKPNQIDSSDNQSKGDHGDKENETPAGQVTKQDIESITPTTEVNPITTDATTPDLVEQTQTTPQKASEVAEDESDSSNSLKYEPGQYHPTKNPSGKRKYSREFLMEVRSRVGISDDIDFYEVPTIWNSNPFDLSEKFGLTKHMGSRQNDSNRRQGQNNYSGRSSAGQEKQRIVITSVSLTQEVELKTSSNPWRPAKEASKSDKAEEASEDVGETEVLKKKFRSILNKLTPNNFDNLADSVTKLHIDTESKLGDVIDIVFAKALAEPGYCVLYGQMCSHLKKTTAEGTNFGNTLLKRCQNQFQSDIYSGLSLDERKIKIEEEQDPAVKKQLEEELYEDMYRCRMRGLGLIKFIGELYKIEMLNDAIMFDCILRLLSDNQSEEALECLCDLLVTIGEKLDTSTKHKAVANAEKEKERNKTKSTPKAYQTGQKTAAAILAGGTPQQQKAADTPTLDYVFEQLHKIRKNNDLPLSKRIRFKLLDTCDLREKERWQSKRAKDNNPKKIQEIRQAHEEKLEQEKRQVNAMGPRRSQEHRRLGHSGGSSNQISSLANESGGGHGGRGSGNLHTSASSHLIHPVGSDNRSTNNAESNEYRRNISSLGFLRTLNTKKDTPQSNTTLRPVSMAKPRSDQ